MLALKSEELENLAQQLLSSATQLEADSARHQSSWKEISQLSNAAAFDAGFARLYEFTGPLSGITQQMSRVSRTLFSTADVVRELEKYMSFLEKLGNYSITATVMLRYIASLSELLDSFCAREIASLCTAIAPPPLKQLSDFSELSSTAIHEFHLMNAPPHILELAQQNPDMQILEAGDGTLVAAFGDIDEAASITTIVAGVGSSDIDGWQSNLNRARTVHSATGSAAVLWLGYQAPSSLPLAISSRTAAHASPQLQAFQTALHHRNPEQRKVVVGYSYGSTVVGKAASHGNLKADALVLVGSPGAGVPHASQLGAPVYSVTGSADPIGFTGTNFDGIHGTDPTSPAFGATVWPSSATHSSYFDDPDFLTRLKTVVAAPKD